MCVCVCMCACVHVCVCAVAGLGGRGGGGGGRGGAPPAPQNFRPRFRKIKGRAPGLARLGSGRARPETIVQKWLHGTVLELVLIVHTTD